MRASLEELFDAADAFLAEPAEGTPDTLPFNQYTTAADCHRLNAAYAKACKVLEAAEATGADDGL